MATWTDHYRADYSPVGTVGFLARVQDQNHGCAEVYTLTQRPRRTNQSHEPRLNGWCGTTNNVAVFAEGMARVARVTKNERCLLVALSPEEQEAALERLGYPGLD